MPAIGAIMSVASAALGTAVQVRAQNKAEDQARAEAAQQEAQAKAETTRAVEQSKLKGSADAKAKFQMGSKASKALAPTIAVRTGKGAMTSKARTPMAASGALDVSASRVGGL